MISYIATVFIVDMVLLLAAGGYGFFCAITNPNQYINPSLCGRRAKVAVFVPFLWFYHVLANAKTVYGYCQAVEWNIPHDILVDIAVRQSVGMVGTMLNVLLIAGYNFDKQNGTI